MDNGYDLFELRPRGFPEWIGSASDLPEVRKKIQSLPAPPPGGQYFAREFRSGMVVAYTVPGSRGPTIFPPANDPRDPSVVLKSELAFLASGGYDRVVRTAHQPKLIFRDSPTCINFGDPNRTRPCERCLLMEFVPPAGRAKALPCHQIPLNAEQDSVERLTAKGSKARLEQAVALWLKTTLARLPEPCARSTAARDQTFLRSEGERNHGPRVLIVDQDDEASAALARELKGTGYDAIIARREPDALRLAGQESFDLILLDAGLRDVTSEAFLRQLRAIAVRTPVVVMEESSLREEDAARLARLGACYFVSKRSLEDLATVVPNYVARARQCAAC